MSTEVKLFVSWRNLFILSTTFVVESRPINEFVDTMIRLVEITNNIFGKTIKLIEAIKDIPTIYQFLPNYILNYPDGTMRTVPVLTQR